ncbi:glycosyltransferase family 2 protein [Neoroseomonas soli]|uniref:Glycosyltransferase family 2 protein n=1 Tax=Neoroseomonas soli TaxID=1081025 RepID=A0A9X9WSM7_9PROT|nr:glycosyltransferase family 2 protein [Neoroseomonas soli]
MIRVDVFIPCYNYGRYLRQCVDSVLSQEGCEVRVLIIDDASKDDSLAIARGIAAEDDRVSVLPHPVNRGHIATYNEGIDWVTAPYMLLLSADDLAAPGAFARATRLMEVHPGVAFVHGRSLRFTEEAELAGLASDPGSGEARLVAGRDFLDATCRGGICPLETATAIVRTTAQRRVGGYDPALPHTGDLEMWLRLGAVGNVGVIDAWQACTRMHATNMRHAYAADRMIADFRHRLRAFESFGRKCAPQLATAPQLAGRGRAALSEEVLWAAARAFEADEGVDAVRLMHLARELRPGVVTSALWWKVAARLMVRPRHWQGFARLRGRLVRAGDASRSGQGRAGP